MIRKKRYKIYHYYMVIYLRSGSTIRLYTESDKAPADYKEECDGTIGHAVNCVPDEVLEYFDLQKGASISIAYKQVAGISITPIPDIPSRDTEVVYDNKGAMIAIKLKNGAASYDLLKDHDSGLDDNILDE